jgi:energy-coupling factor transporter transmembrane protein EcfT
MFAALLATAFLGLTRRWQRMIAYVTALLWFAVPLFLIHGTLNQQFPVRHEWLGLPVRPDGLHFAGHVAAQIAVLLVPVLFWTSTVPREVMQLAASLRMPRPLVAIVFQATALVKEVERRGAAIMLAQRARGLRVSGNILIRARALMPVILPLVVGMLRDAPARGRIQHYFGSVDASALLPRSRAIAPGELVAVCTPLLICVGGLLLL